VVGPDRLNTAFRQVLVGPGEVRRDLPGAGPEKKFTAPRTKREENTVAKKTDEIRNGETGKKTRPCTT